MSAWAELPRERQIALHDAVAERALACWGLEGARIDLLKHRENTVYRVTAPDGTRSAMRVRRPGYRSDAELESELVWLMSLRSVGIGTTEVRPCLDGAAFAHVETEALPAGRQCDVLAWVEGKPLGSIEEGVALEGEALADAYRRLGELLARIHDHGESWQAPESFTRIAWDEEGYFGRKALLGWYGDLEILSKGERDLLDRAREATAEALGAFGKSPDRYGLIHGDLLPENVFLDGDHLSLIDWDDSGFGWHVDDIATAMLVHLDRPTLPAALGAMVEGYRRRRALPEDHLAMLPFLWMARGLSYVGWAHSRGDTGRAMAEDVVDQACTLARAILS